MRKIFAIRLALAIAVVACLAMLTFTGGREAKAYLLPPPAFFDGSTLWMKHTLGGELTYTPIEHGSEIPVVSQFEIGFPAGPVAGPP
jgi:hypothetical protein